MTGNAKHSLRFVLPSLLGVLVFLTPIKFQGNWLIGIGILTTYVKTAMGEYGLHILLAVMTATVVLTLVGTYTRVAWIREHNAFRNAFDVPTSWVLIRLFGAIIGFLYFFDVGPAVLRSEIIGQGVLVDIGVNVIAVYVTACILLPLLTDYGFMEFMGTLARPAFRKAFRLPGRSAIDALASFVGAASIGLLITIGQYERGQYTSRQAATIAANFSIVSIPYCLVVATTAGISHMFIPWYGTVIVACLVIALVTSRLPPLAWQPDACMDGSPEKIPDRPEHGQLFKEAWHRANERAAKSPGIVEFFRTGLTNMIFFMFSILTAAMALASIAAIITFETPVFTWLGQPLVPLLEFAQLPQASVAATGLFSGFLDQYMPAITAAGIASDTTSFVLAGLSVCQLIFMSEVGVIILRSSLPLKLRDLFLIFLIRTAICLPVLILGAHLVT